MNKIIVIFFALSAAAVWLNYDELFKKYQIPDRPPFDGSLLPKRALQAVCILGKPVMVATLDKDLNENLVIFPGPVKTSPGANAEIIDYVGYAVSTPENLFGDAINVIRSLDEYESKSSPEKLSSYDLLKTEGLPKQLSEVRELLGPWNIEIQRSNPKRERYVWRKSMCIGKHFVFGLWVEAINSTVIKTKGIKSKDKLERML